MATISRFSAVASIGRLRFSGFFAWVLWLAIHLVYIIGFKHRVTTLLHWAVSFLGRGRSERVATEQQVFGRQAIDVLPHGELPYIPTDPADGEVSGVAELEDRTARASDAACSRPIGGGAGRRVTGHAAGLPDPPPDAPQRAAGRRQPRPHRPQRHGQHLGRRRARATRRPGRTGFAHLFEHLMFQGSRNVRSGEHFEALMAQGARLNATTWFDRTNYFETVPTGAVELALWLEADRHGSPARRRDPGEPRQPARRRQGGEAPALRQPALRQRPHRRLRRGVPRGPPLPPPDDRLDGGPRRREPRRRPRVLPRALRPRQHRAHAVRRHHARSTGSPSWSATSATWPASADPRRARPPAARAARAAGARRAPRGRAQRPAARRASASRSTRPTSSSPRRSRSTASAASRPRGWCAGWSAASRPRSARTPPPGASSTARRSGFVVLDVAPGTDADEVEAAFVEELEGFLEHGPTDGRARGLAGAVRAVLAVRARQPGGARRPDQPPPAAPRRPRRRQHPPRPAARRHGRAGASTRPAAGCGRTAGPSSPTSSPTTRRRRRADRAPTEDVA